VSTETTPVAETPQAAAPVAGGARQRHVYEPHKVGLPPIRKYLRELWRRREFARELSRTNLRAQHFNTVFGQLWLIINPLLLAGIYFILVDILRNDSRGSELLAHLVACLFAYYFVQQSLQQGVKSVVSGGRLILNTAFPRLLLPMASLLTAFTRFLPTLLVYIPIHLAAGLPVTVHMLWVVPIGALLVGVAFGLTTLVAAAQVYFRDLASFLPYALRVLLYISPILYYAYEVPDRYKPLLRLNPLSPILSAWSDVLVQGREPQTIDLLVGLAWALVLILVGTTFFMSREREFAVRL
jgi:teichoic acid transport system permease protein